MKRILIPTDFSENSKSGIKFGLKWAEKDDLHLVFINIYQPIRKLEWTKSEFEQNETAEIRRSKEELDRFILDVFESFGVTPKHYSTEIIEGLRADSSILEYCENNQDINYICISTRGAGGLKKMLGTNTGNLITQSKIPVIAVPQDYQGANLETVLYASDLENYSSEINKVLNFVRPLKLPVEVLHFSWPNEDHSKNDELNRDYEYGLTFSFPPHNVRHKLITNLQDQVSEKQPSVFIMFTNQEKSFWEKLITPSKTEQLSFKIEVPMMVFKKEKSA